MCSITYTRYKGYFVQTGYCIIKQTHKPSTGREPTSSPTEQIKLRGVGTSGGHVEQNIPSLEEKAAGHL